MIIIYILGVLNIAAASYCYLHLQKRKQLFDDRFATTITKTSTLISAMVLSMHLTVLLTIDLSIIFILNIVAGVWIGSLFGSLVKYHSVLNGFYNGIIGSSTGMMVGEVLKNPQICSIPISNYEQIVKTIYYMCGFSTFLLIIVLGLILYSLKV